MLVAISTRTSSRVRLPRVASRPSLRRQPYLQLHLGPYPRLTFSSSTHRYLTLFPRPASLSIKSAMFQRAVQSHAISESSQKPQLNRVLPDTDGSTTEPLISPRLRNLTQKADHPSTRHALLPATSATLNRLGTPSSSAISAVKRTYSGLAKALGHTGEDGFQQRYTSYHSSAQNVNQPGLAEPCGAAPDAVVVFDDDFDSDIDLDVENLVPKDSISCTKSPITYPAVNRKAQLHTQASLDSVYDTSPLREANASSSTQPLPWSSSPDSHFEPPARAEDFASFVDNHRPPLYLPSQDESEATESRSSRDPSGRPPKRRTLPWLDPHAKDSESTSRHLATPVKSLASTADTGLPKTSTSSTYLWNVTASAVKEQQKQFRKANKKSSKEDPATTNEGPIKINAAIKKNRGVSRPHLSQEQRHVLDLVVEHGKSVFFTGSAGTGKSVLLREVITIMRKKFQRESDRVAITASTGLAACNIGGVTLHSFAGIGLGKEEVPELVKKIKRNQKAKHRWMRTKVLVVDEVSMVDGELFDKLEAIARQIRNNSRPFGGIQLVITGDFFQLPPVPDYSNRLATFAFDAKSWDTTIDHTIGLHHVFRQKDPVFANMLNEMREGRLSQHSIKTFRDLSRPILRKGDDGDCEATELFPTRAEVDAANNTKMHQLSGETMRFEARDGGAVVDKMARDKLLSNCMAPQELVLKKGAQVMLIKNIDENLVNGSLGKVLGFMSEELFSSYNTDPQLFSGAQDDEASHNLNPTARREKLKYDVLKGSTSQCWPVVRFVNADGTTRDLLCNREAWKVELPNGEVQASRSQVPLILAWALSIHKAQGQTLEKVKVDLGKVFEKGQAYVALSRATSIDGLQVLRFDPAKVMAHDRVRSFYSKLSSAAGSGQGQE